MFLLTCSVDLWRVLMESDSRWPSDSCQCSAIHNAYHTSLHSEHNLSREDSDVFSTSGSTMRSTWMLPESNSEPWTQQTDVSRAQTNKKGLRITRNNNSDRPATSGVQQNQGEKTTKTPRRVSNQKGTTSPTWAHRQTWLHFSICACHPNILPTLSRDCHITQQVTVLSV